MYDKVRHGADAEEVGHVAGSPPRRTTLELPAWKLGVLLAGAAALGACGAAAVLGRAVDGRPGAGTDAIPALELAEQLPRGPAKNSSACAPPPRIKQCASCKSEGMGVDARASRSSVFDPLTHEEWKRVWRWLYGQGYITCYAGGWGGLMNGDITTCKQWFKDAVNSARSPHEDGNVLKTTVLFQAKTAAHLTLRTPPKDEAKRYLQTGAEKPPRIAEFLVYHIGHNAKKYELDITLDDHDWAPPTLLRTWTWADRPSSTYEFSAGNPAGISAVLELKALFKDYLMHHSFDTFYKFADDTQTTTTLSTNVQIFATPDVVQTVEQGREIHSFTTFWAPRIDTFPSIDTTNGIATRTLPFAGSIDTTDWSVDTPISEWKVTLMTFCTLTGTVESVLEQWNAMDASSKKKMYNSCPLDAGYYANLLPHNSTLEPDSKLRGSKGYKMPDAAQLHAPDGCAIQRFGNHTFRWRGWDFHIAADPFSGLALHDVRFLNETYAYRIALSDVYATYWGGQNHHLLYSDGGYDIGSWGVDLVEGVDCPPEAMYVWNTVDQTSALGTQFLGGAEGFHPVPPFPQEREPKQMRSICLFEMPEGRPLARHHFWAGETNPAYVGMPSTILVARTISTVGNYDYIFDVHFWLDGKMQLSEGATGIATMSYPFLPGEDAWKQQFGPFAKGDLHLHSAGWELDLDVAGGTDNTFVETTYDWTSFPDGMSEAFTQGESNTVVPNRKVIESEQSVQPTEHATYYVRSEGSKNMFGNQKSLKIIAHKTGHPGGDADVRTFFHNISKATYHVVKKNVGEHFGACFQARGDPNSFKCGNDISDFLNDETLNDGGQGTDIVLYVGTNVMHDVVAEDMPMPAVFRDTIMIKPANMFDKAAFKDLSQTLGEGIGSGGTCLPLKMSAPEKTP